MNIRMAIGFIAGVLVVVGLWWMLQHKRIEEKDMAVGSMNPETALNESREIKAVSNLSAPAPENTENNTDATTLNKKTADEKLERLPEEIQTAIFPMQPEPPDTDLEIVQKDEPEASSIVSKTAEPVTPEEATSSIESDLLPENRQLEKHFF